MILLLACLAALFIFAAGITVAGIRSAPEGFEDETGFYTVWQNNTPEARDVVCIWKTLGEENVVSDSDEISQAA